MTDKIDESDWVLNYTGHANGAIANGTRIVKSFSEDGDTNPVGTLGRVNGSLHHSDMGYGYFVEWDTMPGIPVFVTAKKISVAQ